MSKKLLISQPKPEIGRSPYLDLAQKHGLEVIFQPFIKVETLSSLEFREQKIQIPSHTALIFTTKTAIDHFFALAKELRVVLPDTMKYFCQSELVANYLQRFVNYRKRKVFFPAKSSSEELATIVAKHTKEQFLIPLTEGYKNDLLNLLESKKIHCTPAVMFRTVAVDLDEALRQDDYDMVVLFTPMGVKSLQHNFPNLDTKKTKLAAFGPKTAEAIKEAGYTLEVSAPSPDIPSMPRALDLYFQKKK